MIKITKSQTADTRACDFASVTKGQLLGSSKAHIGDVRQGMGYFVRLLDVAGGEHDSDKLSGLDHFHADFLTGFKKTGWLENHRKISRHHLQFAEGVPVDVDLLDVLEMVVDCVMAGMARTGSFYPLKVSDELLQRAFANTVELLRKEVVVAESEG